MDFLFPVTARKQGGQMKKGLLQWHPAFFAGLQIELQEERENLIFENEHQLGTKPKEIDALIIKKEKDIPVKKNIGRIFRKHNIVEYKSPTDYLSIDDYYKGCAYAYFYKADGEWQNAISVEELTLTFVSRRYPMKLAEHLRNVCGYRLEEAYRGIYYLNKGTGILPTQLIVTSKVSEEENLWLWSMTNKLENRETVSRLLDEYGKHREDKLYESVMDIIVRTNYKEFEEVRGNMCKALEELMADVIAERQREAEDKGRSEGRAEGRSEGRAEGRSEGMAEILRNMLAGGIAVEQVAQLVQMKVEEVEALIRADEVQNV